MILYNEENHYVQQLLVWREGLITKIFTNEVLDTEMDRFEAHIPFPSSSSARYDQLKYSMRACTDDTFFWFMETLLGQMVYTNG
ncbi:MAG: hypothetical protein GFH25_541182n11 [Chloroflexi bacterium AL-N10]|nr:hypothetical protein [Chloroflexi bacterium AL-N10]